MNPWLHILGLDADPECPCCGEPCDVDAPDGLHPEAWCAFCEDVDALSSDTAALNAEGVCARCMEDEPPQVRAGSGGGP